MSSVDFGIAIGATRTGISGSRAFIDFGNPSSQQKLDQGLSGILAGPGDGVPWEWWVGQGISEITIECLGAGGAGGAASGFGLFESPAFGGGGGGGSYSRTTLSVTPGSHFMIIVAKPTTIDEFGNIQDGMPSQVFTSPPFSFSNNWPENYIQCRAVGGQSAQPAYRKKYRYYGNAGYGQTTSTFYVPSLYENVTYENIGDVTYRGGNGGGNTPDATDGKWCFDKVTTIGAKVITTKAGACTIYSCSPPDYSGPGGGAAGFSGNGGDATMCSISGGLSRSPLFLYGDLITAQTSSKGGDGVNTGNRGSNGIGYGVGGSGAAVKGTGFGTRDGGTGGGGYVRISWEIRPECLNLYVPSNCCPIAVGCNVYSDSQLTIPAENGYYYDGTKCWIVLNGIINSTGSCGTTTSTTSTTTTTPPPTGFYNVTQYSCPDCDPVGSLIAYSSTTLNIGTYYSIADGYTYLVNGTTSGPSYDVDLSSAFSGASCFALCIT